MDGMDEAALSALSRRELQALAKEHGVKANQKTADIIEDLLALENETSAVDISDKQAEEELPKAEVEEAVPEAKAAEVEAEEAVEETVEAEVEPPRSRRRSSVAKVAAKVEAEEAVTAPVEAEKEPPVSRRRSSVAAVAAKVEAPPAAAKVEAPPAASQKAPPPAAASKAPARPEAKPWTATPFVPQKSVKQLTVSAAFAIGVTGSERGLGSLKSLEAANRKREEDAKRLAASEARREAAKARQDAVSARFKADKSGMLNPLVSGKVRTSVWEANPQPLRERVNVKQASAGNFAKKAAADRKGAHRLHTEASRRHAAQNAARFGLKAS